jgi:hypothetical protein
MRIFATRRETDRRIWIGYHIHFGLVVYDSRMQIWSDDTDVSLYILEEKRFSLFNKRAVRSLLLSLTRRARPVKLVEALEQYGGVAEIAVLYAENLGESRNSISSGPLGSADRDIYASYDYEIEYEPSEEEEEERRLLTEEMMEAQEAWARNEDEGWFYEE